MGEGKANRIFGLDILRSSAIIIVVISHSSYIISDYTGIFSFIPLPDGVDLFFVLSGYLIGTILIKSAEEKGKFDLPALGNFLKRRWFRTLPNYYLFLVLNIILIYFGLIQGTINKYLAAYFVFFQNFYKPFDFLFWESWSLSIEEWFYLLFPVTILVLLKFFNSKIKLRQIIFIAILLFLAAPLFYRLFQAGAALNWDIYFRKIVLARFDTIGFGLLGAFMHWYYNELWVKFRNYFFAGGIILLVVLCSHITDWAFFYETFYFSFTGLSILMLLPKLQSIKNENIPLKPFAFISKISYSMYLIHIPLLQILSRYVSPSTGAGAVFIYIAFWMILIILSYAVFRFYEKPLTDLRDRKK